MQILCWCVFSILLSHIPHMCHTYVCCSFNLLSIYFFIFANYENNYSYRTFMVWFKNRDNLVRFSKQVVVQMKITSLMLQELCHCVYSKTQQCGQNYTVSHWTKMSVCCGNVVSINPNLFPAHTLLLYSYVKQLCCCFCHNCYGCRGFPTTVQHVAVGYNSLLPQTPWKTTGGLCSKRFHSVIRGHIIMYSCQFKHYSSSPIHSTKTQLCTLYTQDTLVGLNVNRRI